MKRSSIVTLPPCDTRKNRRLLADGRRSNSVPPLRFLATLSPHDVHPFESLSCDVPSSTRLDNEVKLVPPPPAPQQQQQQQQSMAKCHCRESSQDKGDSRQLIPSRPSQQPPPPPALPSSSNRRPSGENHLPQPQQSTSSARQWAQTLAIFPKRQVGSCVSPSLPINSYILSPQSSFLIRN